MHTTKHTFSSGGEVEMAGEHLYDVTATTDDGQTDHAVIAADREGSAKTRLMAITTMSLRGQTVDYAVKEIA